MPRSIRKLLCLTALVTKGRRSGALSQNINHKLMEGVMHSKTLFVSCLLLCVLALYMPAAAATMLIINLDAHVHSFGGHPLVVHLPAGTYTVKPVGVIGGGLYDAWSPWPF